ncbi:uncharacterized protein SEPMUDRAFT_123009 [Sphaerulina musiva SO2202]|uniref:Uncharacterized protein n=1 Tax=Sphaerulina musiva (strain SO2202) TaxID=692275 RepID=N1QNE1_SPHMS|nr:uncharacterized protein SEPMUDRAFT_123009 [Sphaerulina musiva SO2202]EMF17678.1 hypothetical protein SEPMUDRAFT_123009 [Sphaerulina musiva SO2202]
MLIMHICLERLLSPAGAYRDGSFLGPAFSWLALLISVVVPLLFRHGLGLLLVLGTLFLPHCRNIQVVGRFVSFGLAVDRAHMAAQEPRILPCCEGLGAGAKVASDLTWLYDECVPEVGHGCECPTSVQPMMRG